LFKTFPKHASRGPLLMFTRGPNAGEVLGTFADGPIYYSSLAEDEYRALLKDHGFTLIEHFCEDPACGQHTIWLAVSN